MMRMSSGSSPAASGRSMNTVVTWLPRVEAAVGPVDTGTIARSAVGISGYLTASR